MKKSIIIILSTLFFSNLYAEKKDLKYYDLKIDSVVSVYSVENYKETRGLSSFFWRADLNVKERKKLIEKIRKMFEQDKYTNLYFVGHELLYEMWYIFPERNPPEINQMLLELNLQYYFYPGRENNVIDSYYYDLDRRKNYTPKAQKRIMEILKGQKTQEEYDMWLKYRKSLPDRFNAAQKEATRLMKRQEIQNDEVLKQIYDSLRNEYAKENTNRYFEPLQIEPDLIKMIGFLNMKECIPTLKQQLSDCIQNKCIDEKINAYRHALARLGDQEQQQYILENLMENFDRREFAYFRDDEIMWKYIEVNYSLDKKITLHGEEPSTPIGLIVMSNVYPFIKNLPQELVYPQSDFSASQNDRDKTRLAWVKSFYEWLMKNRDKVEFDYDGEKDWFW